MIDTEAVAIRSSDSHVAFGSERRELLAVTMSYARIPDPSQPITTRDRQQDQHN